MFPRSFIQRLLSVLLPISIASVIYLYFYPIFLGCAFPLSTPSTSSSSRSNSPALLRTFTEHLGYTKFAARDDDDHQIAPFRLLVLADPQLEGDTSLPNPDDDLWPRLQRHWRDITATRATEDKLPVLRKNLVEIALVDIPFSFQAYRKRLDLLGNDYYLAHIYRALRWWTKPTHVTVLGDLIGSQWVTDAEFQSRAWRFWNRVFRGGVRVDDEITATGSATHNNGGKQEEAFSMDDKTWSNRIINIAGNHDIGYAGDISDARMARFNREFGRANWDVRFQYNAPGEQENSTTRAGSPVPSLHLVVLNSLTLDTPALSSSIQSQTYTYLNDVISYRSPSVEDSTSFTLLLTHLPLHKREGICIDSPHFDFYAEDDEESDTGEPRFKEGGLREQNHLSDHVSRMGILQGLFGMSGDDHAPNGGRGRNGLILTGHDHAGCDVVHFIDHHHEAPAETDGQSWSWSARRYNQNQTTTAVAAAAPETDPKATTSPSIREVTLRSMMGEYGGNAGLLSIWFDADPSVLEWKYEITTCQMGVQHIWWAVHVVALITVVLLLVLGVLALFGSSEQQHQQRQDDGESVGKGTAASAAAAVRRKSASARTTPNGSVSRVRRGEDSSSLNKSGERE
ncbi:hypothetical protein AJ80_08280 [Polytolypa hystricis UAMH7299]|uniref:Calcineurin-like phosphoesterase domain-containing protein n=1 Tax=Polytolypa hystricis (strain UAMH7299) TaxID=1447883 RepID=A0A2B7XAS6_POLH7|nr:hypothetical protein AJ80_08280 [Polytolypa hystricis UAMH7299]